MSRVHANLPTSFSTRRAVWCMAWLLLASVLLAVCGASVGSTGFDSVLRMHGDPVAWQIVWDIRLPRTAGAWLAGALLGLSGAVAQGLFRNPLADPYLLGSASGAALGGAVAMALFGVSPVAAQWMARIGITGMAFLGAAGAVVLTLLLAKGVQHTLRLLLAGVIVGVVLGALRDLVELASPDILQAMQAFTLGSTAFVGWAACLLMAVAWALCSVVAWMLARALDGLTLGEATAASLGLPLMPMRVGLVAAMALATGTAVAQTGLIAFVGLAAPHLVRSIVRVTHERHIVLSSLMGAVLLLAADILARWLLAPQELPVGVLTAALGGTYLLWLMHRRTSHGWCTMNLIAISANGISASIGNRSILQGIDLQLPAGRWTSIVGPNGAGKSTLLKVLAGLMPRAAVQGEVRLLGRPLAQIPARERARQLAWLGQNEGSADDLTSYDVAMLGRLPHQAWLAPPGAADHAAVEQALRTTQAWDWRHRPLSQLSGGERQRVLLARALAVQAQVLLMDEPLANLDPPHQTDWLHTMRALVDAGGTVVSVLHEVSLALQADDMVVMAQGRVLHQGACDAPATHAALESVFDHRIHVRHLDGMWMALPSLQRKNNNQGMKEVQA